jgi:phospholipase/lecithinase/hemolysin
LNDLAVQFNSELQIQLKQWINDMPEAEIFYIDSYTILLDAFNNPAKYGTLLFINYPTKLSRYIAKCS